MTEQESGSLRVNKNASRTLGEHCKCRGEWSTLPLEEVAARVFSETMRNLDLGSAVVHKQPGGAVCIVPVHSQQRGRLFLPFVDNDP